MHYFKVCRSSYAIKENAHDRGEVGRGKKSKATAKGKMTKGKRVLKVNVGNDLKQDHECNNKLQVSKQSNYPELYESLNKLNYGEAVEVGASSVLNIILCCTSL